MCILSFELLLRAEARVWGPPQAVRLPGDLLEILLRVFGLLRSLPLRFGAGPYTLDVLYVVVDATSLMLWGVGHHDVVGLPEKDFRVELLALADGASHPLFTPPPGL